jgi:proteic killer suppression protein
VRLVIKSFQHKGLKQYFTKGNKRGIASFNVERVKRILFAINAASSPLDLMIPGFDTHELAGKRKGSWAITLTGNYRITFKPEGADMKDVHLEDYH